MDLTKCAFSNLWRFSGGATKTRKIDGTGTTSFSNLWRFSGGATPGALLAVTACVSFSNLWRFSGGATTPPVPYGTLVYDLSVISGDSLVGQQAMPSLPRSCAVLSVISGDSLVGQPTVGRR